MFELFASTFHKKSLLSMEWICTVGNKATASLAAADFTMWIIAGAGEFNSHASFNKFQRQRHQSLLRVQTSQTQMGQYGSLQPT